MDEIIGKVGNFGRFQAILFTSTSACVFITAWGMLFMMFGNYNPGWTCRYGQLSNISDVSSTDSSTNTTTHRVEHTHDLAACDIWRACPRVEFRTESSTIVTEWNLMCDESWALSVIITVQMCGVLFGAYFCGIVGDRFGRKISLYGSIAILTVSNLLAGLSNSWEMFASLRFFIGLSCGGTLTSAYIYPLEFVGNWWRPVLSSAPTWSIGCIGFALVAFIFRDWRAIHIATTMMSGLIFLPVFWMPESMRWLAINNKIDDVKHVVQRIASLNGKEATDPAFIEQKVTDIVGAQLQTAKVNYIDLFRTSKIRKYSIKFGFMWFTMTFVYYTISFGVKAFSGNFYLNIMLFTLTEVPGQFLIGPLSNKFGRKFTAGVFLGTASALCIGIVIVTSLAIPNSGVISIVLATIAKMCIISGWGVIILISAELYPTVMRNLQSGYLNALGRFGGILSSYLVSTDDSELFIAYAIMGCLLCACLAIICSVSESKGRPMADIIKERLQKDEEMTIMLDSVPEEKMLI